MVRPIEDAAAADRPHAAQPSVPSNWFVWLVSFVLLAERNKADEPNEPEKPVCAPRANHRNSSPHRSVSGAKAAKHDLLSVAAFVT